MLKGNKGEWSEIYAFCYLLNKGILKAADKDLNPTDDFYPILKIIREETKGTVLNYIPPSNEQNVIKIFNGDTLINTISRLDFKNILSTLLSEIPTGRRAFEIPEVQPFFNNILVHKLKADSAHKQDIDIKLHDIKTGLTPTCGFSIKSYLGSNPTLINAAKTTNFIYTVENCTESVMNHMNEINTRTKIIDRLNFLNISGCKLSFQGEIFSDIFKQNLEFVDSRMPEIIGHILLTAYVNGFKKVSDAVEYIKITNPLTFSNPNMYEYKIKKFLCACALGMTPGKNWEGDEDANGGYIVVKNDGSVVCYHIYNRTDFEQYLYDYTSFDTPSISRHDYMCIYKENTAFKIKLNLQVRFSN